MKLNKFRMGDENYVDRYTFVKENLQYLINVNSTINVEKWRKDYDAKSEWEKITIANKAMKFFSDFKECAFRYISHGLIS